MHSLCLELDLYNFPVRQINNGSASWTIFRCTTSKVFGLDVKSRDVTAESVASTTDVSFDLLLGSASNYSWQCFAAYLRVLRAAGKLRNLIEKWSDWIELQIGSAMRIKLCGNALVEVNKAISLFESDFFSKSQESTYINSVTWVSSYVIIYENYSVTFTTTAAFMHLDTGKR